MYKTFPGILTKVQKRTKHYSCLARNLKPGRTDTYSKCSDHGKYHRKPKEKVSGHHRKSRKLLNDYNINSNLMLSVDIEK